jgi:hypothetical protein
MNTKNLVLKMQRFVEQLKYLKGFFKAYVTDEQCCQLLAKDFGQSNQKMRPLAKNFGTTEFIFVEDVLQKTYASK